MISGDFAHAQSLFLESTRRWETAGCMLRAPLAMLFAGESAFEQLDFAAARRMLDDALIRHRRMGNVHDAAQALRSLAKIALNEGRLDEAGASCAESLRIFRSLHDQNCAARSASILAEILFAAGDGTGALRQAESAAAMFRGSPHTLVDTLPRLGRIHAAAGDVAAARRVLRDAFAAQRRTNSDFALPKLLEAVAGLRPDASAAPTLLASAAVLRELRNLPLFPAERADFERIRAAVLAKHPATAGATAALSRDEAIACASALLQDREAG